MDTVNTSLNIENTKCCFVMTYNSTHLQPYVPYIGLTLRMSFYYNAFKKDFKEVTPSFKCFHAHGLNNSVTFHNYTAGQSFLLQYNRLTKNNSPSTLFFEKADGINYRNKGHFVISVVAFNLGLQVYLGWVTGFDGRYGVAVEHN